MKMQIIKKMMTSGLFTTGELIYVFEQFIGKTED